MNRVSRPFILAFSLFSAAVSAAEWHVSGDGNDSSDGRTPATAWRTLQRAEGAVKPGDVVLVGNGLYTDAKTGDGSAVLNITSSGTADAWITWKARPGHQPVVSPIGWAGIQVTGSYLVIEGFTVTGANDSIVLLDALEDAKKKQPSARFNSNGILIEGRRNKPDAKPHHIIVRRNVVSKMPGGGITALEGDYITVEDNLVFDNAWFMRYGGSGITFLDSWAHDDKPGYHIVVQRNKVWNNKTLVPWERIGKLSDGNGILLDVTEGYGAGPGATNPNADAIVGDAAALAGQVLAKRPIWTGRALIANNISAFNGGSGIHTFRTAYVDIINNTTYWNGDTVGYQELFANRSREVTVLNNVIVPRPGGKVTSNNRNEGLRWDYNLYPVEQNVVRGPKDIVADPQFIRVDRDLRKADFRLSKGSPALHSGTSELAQAVDHDGAKRPQGAGVDRGAFEQ
ncbi:choice-of-anchor Q domain-containing protein [Paucibacter sp. M5-1]|uniref:choice-of-anchor Q domain-containing protein n=1 Tax=Paucibacter sp. M5-1 TaxID=3015998 RepID=UPI0022B923DC|nr:right-handed parallel beta-helix repeat-containing protein [Paucibacter sp. M5-1]MCZ7883022.1 right-handed parallel beta-helix repeat-containing protein [Paucibacter sp. M5-1]